jgi:hypothetical protein
MTVWPMIAVRDGFEQADSLLMKMLGRMQIGAKPAVAL